MNPPIYDGGPAFPLDAATPANTVEEQKGMSLRDYFAANAMVGLMTMPDEWRGYFRRDGNGSTWKAEAAKAAYEVADAMLRAREGS
ncbi:hypothetical protein WM08_14965 [Burkholderia ubonensis]|uniref:hypothetical protein n=1 Tax=Burkholderia ubonensis TaxID=101571 RepID=UPI00075F729C|nr:hypothetical protein [Burkholderia ubonensis]KWI90158.1 hypothetical protein WM08_14965 [Burkholderia ubonensis]